MSTIERLTAIEILDSRGRPTLKTTCKLASGIEVSASVPSGASTGRAEALELRDGEQRYRGLGCLNAVHNVNTLLNQALAGRNLDQAMLDLAMLELDGTANKSRLGANAILSVSLAFARACSYAQGISLYQYFSSLTQTKPALPNLTINLFSGGKHAGGQVDIQDVLMVPHANSINVQLAMAYEVYQVAADMTSKKYSSRSLKADEGGLAPDFASTTDMLQDTVQAIQCAGLIPGKDMSLAVDVASSHFYRDELYSIDGQHLTALQMMDKLESWLENYPIISLEDGLAEEDWLHWPLLCRRLGRQALILGDDFLCTNPQRIQKAIQGSAANALLLKVNQIGTLTEAARAYKLAQEAGWKVVVSARSGETEDDWLADLAVGWAGDYVKIGSITQSERLAKYNRLLEIEAAFAACSTA